MRINEGVSLGMRKFPRKAGLVAGNEVRSFWVYWLRVIVASRTWIRLLGVKATRMCGECIWARVAKSWAVIFPNVRESILRFVCTWSGHIQAPSFSYYVLTDFFNTELLSHRISWTSSPNKFLIAIGSWSRHVSTRNMLKIFIRSEIQSSMHFSLISYTNSPSCLNLQKTLSWLNHENLRSYFFLPQLCRENQR